MIRRMSQVFALVSFESTELTGFSISSGLNYSDRNKYLEYITQSSAANFLLLYFNGAELWSHSVSCFSSSDPVV